MAKNNAWSKIKSEKTEDKARYRDVYNRQQLERSQIEEKTTMTGRAIIALIVALVIGAAAYYLISLAGLMVDGVDTGVANMYAKNDAKKTHESPYEYITFMSRDDKNNVNINSAQRYFYVKESGKFIPNTISAWPTYVGFGDEEITENTPVPEIVVRLSEDANDHRIAEVNNVKDAGNYGYVYSSEAREFYIVYPDGTETEIAYEQIADSEYLKSIGFKMCSNKFTGAMLKRGEIVTNNFSNNVDYRPYPVKVAMVLLIAAAVYFLLYFIMKKNLDAQNIMSETADINQYQNDQHIALPEEVQRMYDIFPDAGAHSSVVVSSMISHQMLTNKGLNKVKLSKFVKKDYVDEETGETIYKGTLMRDLEGNVLYDEVPMIDEKFGNDLFTASSVPEDDYARRFFNPNEIEYNVDNKNRDKLQGKITKGKKEVSKYNTVADVINYDWELPEYEPQRPGGMYIVDTAPVNTMV